MPLKIQLNGQMQQLTGPGRPLVVFANGQKHVSTKGITFINGVKKVLWSANDLRIDYIPNIYNVCGTTALNAVWASNNKIILSSSVNNAYGIWRVNVENKSAPVLESNVDLGRITCFSPVDSTASNMVYYAVAGTQKAQQININPKTAEITASNVVNLSSTTWGNLTGGLIGTNVWLGVFSATAISGQLRLNTEIVDTWGWTSTSETVSGSFPLTYMYKKNATSFLVPTFDRNQKYVSEATATGLQTRITGVDFNIAMTDPENNNIICAGKSGFAIYAPDYSLIAQTVNTENYTSYYLLGKIRDYYYVVSAPTSRNATDQSVYLYVYDTNGTLFTQQTLNLQTQFTNSYSNDLISTVPTISQTGALAFVFYPSSSNAYNTQTQLVLVQGY